MALTDAERKAKQRAYERGYARQPWDGGVVPSTKLEKVRQAAWCEGLWRSHADTGLFDCRPKPGTAIPKKHARA